MSGDFFRYLPASRRRKVRKKKVSTQSSFLSSLAPKNISLSPKDSESETALKKEIRGVGEWKKTKGGTKPILDVVEFDILIIDRKIRELLSNNISTIPELQEDLQKTLWILSNGQPSQRIHARRNAFVLRRRIRDLESTMELLLYTFRTSDILEEYRLIVSSERKKSFVTITTTPDNPLEKRKEEIIAAYLRIAKDYVELINFTQKPQKMFCPSCNGANFTVSIEEDSIFICNDCFAQVELLDETPSFKDANRVNLSSKYTYTKKGHFIDAIKRFQGIQNTDPEKIRKVTEVLREEMRKHNLTAERDQRNSVSKDHLYMFLSEQDLSNHYDDINLLFHIITGESCPDISHLVDDLYEDFDKLDKAYEKIKDPDRINSLNVDYKLYKLLQRRGYPCKKDEDFYILKTKAKEDEHDEKMRESFSLLGWEWSAS